MKKESASLLKVRKVLLEHGYLLSNNEGKYEAWVKKDCLVWIYVQPSDRFQKTFLNITIVKRGYSRVVVVGDVSRFKQMLRIVEMATVRVSKEVLEGKTHFHF